MRRALKITGIGISAAFILLILCAGFAWVFLPLPDVPAFEKVRTAYSQSEGKLLDRHGELIHELRIDRQGRRLDWTALHAVSPAMQSAVVFGEDHRFFRHRGIDWISLGAAFLETVGPGRGRGASTITMQFASLQENSLKPGIARRSLAQKALQLRTAHAIEKTWTKAQILEAYLNLASFRGELQGIRAAARGLFAKDPQGLTSIEAAILAALLRAPNAEQKVVALRALSVLKKMGFGVEAREVEKIVSEVLSRPPRVKPAIALAPHVALRLFGAAKSGGEMPATLSCTLDGSLQAFAADALYRHVLSAKSENMHDGAVIVVDNPSGDVLAYVGNIGARASAMYVDGIRAPRQAGSTLKPFIYALAFDRRIATPASLIDDSPLDVPVTGGIYRPRNYDNRFHGAVTARVALASSLNVPAVKMLNLIGVDSFIERLRELEFGVREPEFYGPSVALGSADVSLWDLTNAYRALANGGEWSRLRLVPNEPAGLRRRVFSAEASFLVSDILSDRESRSVTFQLESPLATRFWTAVKTGTSKDMRDNWCIGFSGRYTVGVWAGNFSGEPMWNVSGITGAAPVWIEIMNRLHSIEPSRRPPAPRGVVSQEVELAHTGQTREEWFIVGTESASVQPAADVSAPRIVYPTEGTVIALDPDIPEGDQRVFFESVPARAGTDWILDGARVGSAASPTPWQPKKGRHILTLRDSEGRNLDTIVFEVRGNL